MTTAKNHMSGRNDGSRNSQAISDAYTRHYGDLLRYITSYTHDTMAAEDMIHDIFLKLMSLDVFTETTAKGLLFVIARRMIIDAARHKAIVRQAHSFIRNSFEAYEFPIINKVEMQQMLEFEHMRLVQMDPKRANVYTLFRHEELSAKEIADRLRLSRRSVETHIYLASKEMRDYLRSIDEVGICQDMRPSGIRRKSSKCL